MRYGFWIVGLLVGLSACRAPTWQVSDKTDSAVALTTPASASSSDAPSLGSASSPSSSATARPSPVAKQALLVDATDATGASRSTSSVRPASAQATDEQPDNASPAPPTPPKSEEIPRPAPKAKQADALPKPEEVELVPRGVRPVRALDPAAAGKSIPALSLREVSESVYVAFPALEALRQEMTIASGKELSTWGEFDLKVKGESMAGPMGYYQNYRHLLRLEQGVFQNGSTVFGQYRLGDGFFPPWFGERETNEGGEFKAGLILPLLRDRAIDQRRADIFQATLRRQQVDPMVQGALLEFNQAAADAFWSWVAAGLNYDVQYDLMRVTIERNRGFEERVRLKDLATIELVQNRRLIASREAKVIEALRKLQQSGIKLSMFLRDDQGQPAIPSPALLPPKFPEPDVPDADQVGPMIASAMAARPELAELDFQREQAEVDLAAGQNMRLPGVSAVMDASKDVGAPSSKKGDKTPFQLEAGVLVDVPLQRRKAAGKIREAEGKLAQLAAKRQFMENKIEVQVRDALSALATSHDRVLRARESLALARQLEQAERDRFEVGESDLLRVALQETAALEAAVTEIEALAEYYKAQAALHAALGLHPLEGE